VRGRLTLVLALPVAMALAVIGGRLATPHAVKHAPLNVTASWNAANDSP